MSAAGRGTPTTTATAATATARAMPSGDVMARAPWGLSRRSRNDCDGVMPFTLRGRITRPAHRAGDLTRLARSVGSVALQRLGDLGLGIGQ
jgi:hypothetical protein